jgi:hypothetical protein
MVRFLRLILGRILFHTPIRDSLTFRVPVTSFYALEFSSPDDTWTEVACRSIHSSISRDTSRLFFAHKTFLLCGNRDVALYEDRFYVYTEQQVWVASS